MNALMKAYQKLLVREESLAGVDEALRLLQEALGARIEHTAGALALKFVDKVKTASLNGWLDDAAKALHLKDLDRAAAARPRSAAQRLLETRVCESALYLALAPLIATHAEPALSQSRLSLVNDLGLVLFQQAYFALLPELEQRPVEQKAVLTACEWFAERQERAADRFHVLALVHSARGETKRAAEYFQEVVAATAADEHDFLTCVQAAWSYLIEQAEHEQAFTFLVNTMPRVTFANQEEFRELLQQTFRSYKRHFGAVHATK